GREGGGGERQSTGTGTSSLGLGAIQDTRALADATLRLTLPPPRLAEFQSALASSTKNSCTLPCCAARCVQAAQQSQGIQTLLEAEKDAAKVVQQARQYRQQRLKDARAEATKEIEAYKRTKEAEFKAFEDSVRAPLLPPLSTLFPRTLTLSLPPRQHAGINQEVQAAVDKDTEVKLQSITDAYLAHKDTVVKKLLDRVVLVKPELHRNLRKAGLE
ncbi:hypothetical protein EVG20_g11697, partial [Dentipellis fragilis]